MNNSLTINNLIKIIFIDKTFSYFFLLINKQLMNILGYPGVIPLAT